MIDPESANVGVVIGFIVTAIVLAIGVVILYQVQFCLVEANKRTFCNTRDCKQLNLVHDPEQPCHNHTERIQSSFHRPNSYGGRWDLGSSVYARREPQSVIPARSNAI